MDFSNGIKRKELLWTLGICGEVDFYWINHRDANIIKSNETNIILQYSMFNILSYPYYKLRRYFQKQCT